MTFSNSRSFKVTTFSVLGALGLAVAGLGWYLDHTYESKAGIDTKKVTQTRQIRDNQTRFFFDNVHQKDYLSGQFNNGFGVIFTEQNNPQLVTKTLDYLGGIALYKGAPEGMDNYPDLDLYLLTDNASAVNGYKGLAGVASFDKRTLQSLEGEDLELLLIHDYQKNSSQKELPGINLEDTYFLSYTRLDGNQD
ncbi:MAG: hypothetical protein ACQESG_03575 [Nanobdellota archaeon]